MKMNELEFARKHLGQFRVEGDEIIPELCPYCNGGSHHDKKTFALNMVNHTFNCKRGSCGKQGHFSQLLKDFGEEPERQFTVQRPKRSYKRPEPLRTHESDTVRNYITLRGIKPLTAELYGLTGNPQNEVVFPFFENESDFKKNEPTFIKYRPAHKISKGENKARREKDTKPILFGMHLCKPEGTLFIFEGEFDCMVGYQATSYNCVSVPSGCSDFTWLETCEKWLEQYDTVAIIGDNDNAGREMIKRLTDKMTCKILIPDFEKYGGCKDANEILFRYGEERIKNIMDTVKPVPVDGILNITDIKYVDVSQLPKVLTGIKKLDSMLGGLFDGDLTIWTGKRGEGKSTILTQISLYATNQGKNVCVYSGEIPASRFKNSLYAQAAGKQNLTDYLDKFTNIVHHTVPKAISEKIDQWLNGKYWVYDNTQTGANEPENIIKIFEMAYKRCDCTFFIVDNLMTIQTDSPDYYREQFKFAQKLDEFSKKYNVCIQLVVHPRKTNDKEKIGNDDVGGSGNLTNIACNVISIRRLDKENQAKYECDAIADVIKNRMYGTLGAAKLYFEPYSKTFCGMDGNTPYYDWQSIGNDDTDEPLPF